MTAPLAPRSLDDDTPDFVAPARRDDPTSTLAPSTGTYSIDTGPVSYTHLTLPTKRIV